MLSMSEGQIFLFYLPEYIHTLPFPLLQREEGVCTPIKFNGLFYKENRPFILLSCREYNPIEDTHLFVAYCSTPLLLQKKHGTY